MRYPDFREAVMIWLALVVVVTPSTAFLQGSASTTSASSTCLFSRFNVNVNGTLNYLFEDNTSSAATGTSPTTASRKIQEQSPVLGSSSSQIDIPGVSNSDNIGSSSSSSSRNRGTRGDLGNAPSGYLNSLLVLHRHSHPTVNNGYNSNKPSKSRSFSRYDPQSLLQMNDSLNSLNGVARDNSDGTTTTTKNDIENNNDNDNTPSNPLLAVANTKASTTVVSKKTDKNKNNKQYNNNKDDTKKNSQEIIRTIHLRNFHRILEQVKILEASSSTSDSLEEDSIRNVLMWTFNAQLWRPVLASGLYATWVAVFASRWIQPPAWTIAQHVLPATPTLIQSLTTPTLGALSIPLMLKWAQRALIQGTLAYQRRKLQLQISVQVKALARTLYQALDECIQRIPSSQQQQNGSSWLPRPHPMLVKGGTNSASSYQQQQQQQQDMQSAAKTCQDILVAAKCLALVGYYGSSSSSSPIDNSSPLDNEEMLLSTVFSEKDGGCDRILAATSTTDRMAALLERIRQVTCRLKCRDLPSPHLWEERIMALESNLDLLSSTATTTTSTSMLSGENGLPISLRRSIRWRWKNARRGLAKVAMPVLWMGLFPWVLACRPAIPPVAVVWSSLLCSTVAVTVAHFLEQPWQVPNDYASRIMVGNAVAGSSWGRQILDIVQQHMTMPTEPATSSSSTGGSSSSSSSSGTKKPPSSKNNNKKESTPKKSNDLLSLPSLSRRSNVIASTNTNTTVNTNATLISDIKTTLNTTATLANATSDSTKTATTMDANNTIPETDRDS